MRERVRFSGADRSGREGPGNTVPGTGTEARDLPRRRQQRLAGLAAELAADVWVWTLQALEPPDIDAAYLGVADAGWAGGSQRRAWLEGTFSREFWSLLKPVAERLGGPLTVIRRDLLDDRSWYDSEFYRQHRAPEGLDDFLLSFHPAGAGLQSVVRLHRFAGRPPFDADDRERAHRSCLATPWLHAAPQPDGELPSTKGLSRREKQVLLCLLQGDGKKQIAAKLGISEHTVGDYTKRLHEHFDVQSRGELLALFIPAERLRDLV